MIQLDCPWCGPRNVSEFHHHGEVTHRPDPSTATPQQWREYLYVRANVAGWTTENWQHGSGCRRFFTIDRNTVTNETRPAGSSASGAAAAEPEDIIAPSPAEGAGGQSR